jgi:hypothetical protein
LNWYQTTTGRWQCHSLPESPVGWTAFVVALPSGKYTATSTGIRFEGAVYDTPEEAKEAATVAIIDALQKSLDIARS